MPAPVEVAHSSRLPARERPPVTGWVFAEDALSVARVAVVLAPDGAAQAVSIRWARGLLARYPAPGIHNGYTLRLVEDIVELTLGPELAREVVERVDVERLEVFPRAWSVTAQEMIRSAVDGDRGLAGYGPPGWQPGPSKSQHAIRELLAQTDLGVSERAARLADLLLQCGVPKADISDPLPIEPLSLWMLFVRFGEEVELEAEWEQLDDPSQRAGLALNGDAELRLVGTAFRTDINELAPELLRALSGRHRAFADLPFGHATETDG